MENHHYKWQFSIAMLVYQRVSFRMSTMGSIGILPPGQPSPSPGKEVPAGLPAIQGRFMFGGSGG